MQRNGKARAQVGLWDCEMEAVSRKEPDWASQGPHHPSALSGWTAGRALVGLCPTHCFCDAQRCGCWTAACPAVAFLEARLDSERAWAGLSNSSPKNRGRRENRRSPLRVRDGRLGR